MDLLHVLPQDTGGIVARMKGGVPVQYGAQYHLQSVLWKFLRTNESLRLSNDAPRHLYLARRHTVQVGIVEIPTNLTTSYDTCIWRDVIRHCAE
jgi:hypothetical protein